MNKQFEEVCHKMEAFNTKVTSADQRVNKMGFIDGTLTVVASDDMNLPKDILDLSTGLTQSIQQSPVHILDQMTAVEHVQGPVQYEITFRYDRRFVYTLDHAYANEIYKRHNKEADEWIEKWLGEDDGHK